MAKIVEFVKVLEAKNKLDKFRERKPLVNNKKWTYDQEVELQREERKFLAMVHEL